MAASSSSFCTEVQSFLREQELLLLILAAIGLARIFPIPGVYWVHPEITATWLAVVFIFILAGLGLQTSEFAKAFQNVRFNVTIQFFSFFFVSGFVYVISQQLVHHHILNNSALADGMVICSCLPMAINTVIVITKSANGDEASAVFNAAAANLVGVFVSPFLILFYLGLHGTMNPVDVFIELTVRVLLPVLVGQVLQRVPLVQQYVVSKYKSLFKQLQQYCLVFIIYTVFCQTFLPHSEETASSSGSKIPVLSTSDVATMILCQFFLLISVMGLAWLLLKYSFPASPKLRVMGFVGCTFKTVAAGVPLVNAMYAQTNPELVGMYTLPLLVWHPMQLILGSLLAPHLAAFVSREEEMARQGAGGEVTNEATALLKTGVP
jgi:solute carrier family 10 (sodium/bile acid cotransporter), member 7